MSQNLELTRKLVDLFYPLVELTVFTAKREVQEILNTFSHLKEDQSCAWEEIQMGSPFQQNLSNGRSVRCLLSPLYEDKQITHYVRFRYDLSHFKNLQEQLSFLLQSTTGPTTQATDPWKESIDQTISHYVTEKKITTQTLSAKEKRELLSRLRDKGLLAFKESSAYVASKLQTSRATIYNYLKTAADFKKVHVHQVDTFTNERFGGNPAGVVLDADDLDEMTMRKIARELNLSETSFVLPSKKGSFQMRYFTPTGHEITFCGHSTIGALYMIAKERRFGTGKEGKHTFSVETPCGILQMEASIDAAGGIQLAYETPTIQLEKVDISHEMIAQAAGFDKNLIDLSFPVMYEKTNQDVFVVIKTLEDLQKIECDTKSLASFSKHHNIVVLCLVTPETFDQKNQFHMRCFAPLVGISEDPFTGSVLGGLTAYVDTFGLLPKNSSRFRVEQGHFMNRPGMVEVSFSKHKTYQAKVFAQAVHCFSTEIHLT